VTGWLVNWETVAFDLAAGAARRQSDVAAYRKAVPDVVAEIARLGDSPSLVAAERILTRRLFEPEFAMVLSAMPGGPDVAFERVLHEVETYQHSARNSGGSLAATLRIALQSQIDVLWWGHLPAYETDAEVLAAKDLLDLDALRRDGMLLFRYRRQAWTLLGRAARSAGRLAAPDHTPRTAGLRFALARAELIVMLNQIAADFASLAPDGTPPLWVTSLTRSEGHQRYLRTLGYSALLPSAHCVGYAADMEMAWFRRFHAADVLQRLLLERQLMGEINVIDEGQAWHVCLRPGAGRALRLLPEQHASG